MEQEKSDEAQALLAMIEEHEFHISDFSLHSIGVLLFRNQIQDVFEQFVEDFINGAGTQIVVLSVEDLKDVIDVANEFKLDFDDAYQYVASIKFGLSLVSYDHDFDRTEYGRKLPAEIMNPGS